MREIDRLTQGEREERLVARLHAGARPDEVDALTPPFFFKIQIQTLTHCNAACVTCPHPIVRGEVPSGVMREETYRTILAQIAGRGVERLSLFLMNEPTLDARLEEWTRLARLEVPEAKVTIITNGLLLDADRARSLAEAGMGEITVSLNGLTRSEYERTMSGLSFDRVVANLRAIGRARERGELGGMEVRVTTLELGDARRHAERMAERIGLPIHLKPVTNRAGSVDVRSLPLGSQPSRRRLPCQRPFVKAYVLFDGDMVLCNCDWRRTTIVGNVHRRSLSDLWRDEVLRRVRRAHLTGRFAPQSPCARCDYPRWIEA